MLIDIQKWAKKAGRFLVYLISGYAVYVILDSMSRYIFSGSKNVYYFWDRQGWFTYLFLLYGAFLILAYTLLRDKPMKKIVIYGIISGILLEFLIFEHRKFIELLIYYPIFYGILFYVPFKLIRKIPFLSKQ